jgi:hypothetical protein
MFQYSCLVFCLIVLVKTKLTMRGRRGKKKFKHSFVMREMFIFERKNEAMSKNSTKLF